MRCHVKFIAKATMNGEIVADEMLEDITSTFNPSVFDMMRNSCSSFSSKEVPEFEMKNFGRLSGFGNFNDKIAPTTVICVIDCRNVNRNYSHVVFESQWLISS